MQEYRKVLLFQFYNLSYFNKLVRNVYLTFADKFIITSPIFSKSKLIHFHLMFNSNNFIIKLWKKLRNIIICKNQMNRRSKSQIVIDLL